MEFRPRLGEVVRTLRRERGWTQGRVAKEVGYSTQSPLSKIENGQKGASFQEIWALCTVLGYSMADIEEGLRAVDEGRIADWVKELRAVEGAGDSRSMARSMRLRGPDAALMRAALSGEAGDDEELMGEMVRGMTAFIRLLSRLGRVR